MTEEQEEAIEKLEHVNRYYDCNNYYSRYELDCIETVLNMIKEKDKQIDLMAEHIQNGCDFDNRIKTKKDIKQYFKSKAEKE